MQRQLESVLEARLAAVLMGELMRPRDLRGDVADIDDTFVDIVLDDLELEQSADYYASFEIVRELASTDATTEFVRVRDTTHDHITTIKFARESIDADTLRFPRYSAPYELIDIQDCSHAFVKAPPAVPLTVDPNAKHPSGDRSQSIDANALRFPLYSAPYERVDIQDCSYALVDWSAESTEIVSAPKPSSHVILMVSVLVGALALGLGIALFAI